MVQAIVTEPEASAISIRALRSHLPLRIRPAVPLDDDQLYEFCRANGELRIERTRGGEVIIMPPTGSETGRRNFNFIGQLAAWVARDGTGVGFDSSTGFILPNGAERSPDAAWVRREVWERLSSEQRAKFAPLCPDFVVEIRSPSDDLDEPHDKLRECMECGSRLGWLLDPVQRRVWVYRPGVSAVELHDPERLTGDPELPGFVLECEPIW